MLFSALLPAHVLLGFAAIALGPVAMLARKGPGLHPRIGEAYHAVVLGVCLTAAGLAILDWARLWGFLPIALASYAFALVGYSAGKLRFRGWLQVHVIGQGGSYIAMVTALLVVNWQAISGEAGLSSAWAWVIPTLLGTPLIAWTRRRVSRLSGQV
jgi:uncharacterized membrane protein